MPTKLLKIATACLIDDDHRVLVVRKRNTRLFMLPGGKADPGETPICTLLRELREELDLWMNASQLVFLGQFQARAANEPGHWVIAEVFVGKAPEAVRIQAEIEESGWITLKTEESQALAPLLRDKVLPALRRHLVETASTKV